jgi:hypothetical protein
LTQIFFARTIIVVVVTVIVVGWTLLLLHDGEQASLTPYFG